MTQTAQQAMVQAWNVPRVELPGFLPRLARSLAGLAIIGSAFIVNAVLATLATGGGHGVLLGTVLLAGTLILNAGLYVAAFRALTPSTIPLGPLVPGAVVSSTGFTFLITLGSGLVQHQVRHSSATYGQFGVVIGLVAFLFLLAKISLYGAELNTVVHRHLWPRGLQDSHPTAADHRVLSDIARQNLPKPAPPTGGEVGQRAQDRVAVDAGNPESGVRPRP